MHTSRPTIFLGDLIHTLYELQPTDDATREAIIALLSIHTPKSPLELSSSIQTPSTAPSFTPPLPMRPVEEPQTPPVPTDTTLVPSILEYSDFLDIQQPSEIPPLKDEPINKIADPLPDSLFQPNWRRSILSAALATYSEDGPLALDRLTQLLTHIKPIERIPRQPWPTLRRGIQLLVDCSEALIPFMADQDELQESIIRLVGPDKTQVLNFAGIPLKGAGAGPRMDWTPYQPPPPGTPVVLLTDLGIGQPMFSGEAASPEEWFAFALKLRRSGCPVVAFVPYVASRWPAGITRVMNVILWDRRTTSSTLRYQVRLDYEVE